MCYDVHPDQRQDDDRHGRIARTVFLWCGTSLTLLLVILQCVAEPCTPIPGHFLR